MLASQRQEEILKIASQAKYLEVEKLSLHFGVSKITIYRDLKKLDGENKLKKVHGGAMGNEQSQNEPAFLARKDVNIPQKMKAANNAVKLINEGDNIILDSSTTSLYIAREIVELNKSATIITNNIDITFETMSSSGIQTILLGGVIRDITHSIVGPLSLELLSKLNADKFFFSCVGISKEKGVTDINLDEIAIKKKMSEIAKESILVIDHEKVDKISLYPVLDYKEINKVVTDNKEKNHHLNFLKKYNIEVLS